MLLHDERRTAVPEGIVPAAFLAPAAGRRVVGDGELRAIVRRIAATRAEAGLGETIRRSPSFGARVVAALGRDDLPATFETLAGHVRDLLAFSDAIDVRSAVRGALAAAPVVDGPLRIDAALVADADDAFAWRRLAVAAGSALEVVDLGPLAAPVDPALVGGVVALLRYAGSQTDADARRALVAPQSGVAPDEARTLLAIAGERSDVLTVIARGAGAAATRFAQGLATLTAAYRVPDASAGTVLAACATIFPFDDAPTVAALTRIAADFDAARAFAPAWEAGDLIAEILAELDVLAPRTGDARPDPAPPRTPETTAPVAVRKLTFSASALNAYAECSRKWWFRYVCAAVEDRGSSASFYGIAFHAALEEFHGVYARFDDADPQTLEAFLDGCVTSAFDRHRTRFDAPVEFELQRRRARRTAKKYLAWLLDRARRAPFTVIGCETAIELELDGHRFVGYVDRIDRDDRTGTVTIVDYKTGSIATSAEDYLAEVRAFREFQLPFYYWARSAAGDVVTRLALIPLKDALLDVEPVELEVVAAAPRPTRGDKRGQIAVGELERAKARMIALAGEIASGTREAYPATDDPEACRWCAYAPACRDRPVAIEERFGR